MRGSLESKGAGDSSNVYSPSSAIPTIDSKNNTRKMQRRNALSCPK